MNMAEYIPVAHNDDYQTYDVPLFVGTFPYYQNTPCMVQGRIHLSDEQFSHSFTHEIIPLKSIKGKRHYVNMQPYVLEPQVFLTMRVSSTPKHYADQDKAVGNVLSTQVKGMKKEQLGNSQAWYYPQDKIIVMWECYLDSRARNSKSLLDDPHMPKLWEAFEQWLCLQFPQATRIVTPFNDPIAWTIEEYQTFLHSLHYTPIAQVVYGKDIKR